MSENYKWKFTPRDPSIARQRSLQRQAEITPGLRYADPSQNLPMTPDNTAVAKATDWQAKFPKSQWAAGVLNPNPSAPLTGLWSTLANGPSPAAAHDDIPSNPYPRYRMAADTANPVLAQKLPAPPVSVMANPPSASEVWQKAALTPRKVGQGTLIPTPSTGGGTIISPFGFASSSRPNAKTALKFGGYG